MATLFDKLKNTQPPATTTDRADRVDQCKVIWYQWEYELSTDDNAFSIKSLTNSDDKIAASRVYDISNHVEGLSYSKELSGAAGGFTLSLSNGKDWARLIRPGQWLAIYLTGAGDLPLPVESYDPPTPSQRGPTAPWTMPETPAAALPRVDDPTSLKEYAPRLRCLGIVQRVGIQSNTSTDGNVEITYTITGKDFGAIYEDTELWFNAQNAGAGQFKAAFDSSSSLGTRNLVTLLKKYHEVFLNPNSALSIAMQRGGGNAFFPLQWIMPKGIFDSLSLSSTGPYFGSVSGLLEFSPTMLENNDPEIVAGLSGRCWDRLKGLSQPEFHELFTELSDRGKPRLYFRPTPWALDTSGYPTLAQTMITYADLASGEPVLPPLPLNLNFADSLIKQELLGNDLANEFLANDVRTDHTVLVPAVAIESFDVGPDYHTRANFFLVDSTKGGFDQSSSVILKNLKPGSNWPLRDENDIKRHGFKPLHMTVNSYLISNSAYFEKRDSLTATESFYMETNELVKDFHANAEDFYSGTISLATGLNTIKLGKVLVTDETVRGIPEHAFYIEGYSDSFSVSGDGACSWTQHVSVTRGMSMRALSGDSTKLRDPTQTGSFHAFNKTQAASGDAPSAKDQVVNKLKKRVGF